MLDPDDTAEFSADHKESSCRGVRLGIAGAWAAPEQKFRHQLIEILKRSICLNTNVSKLDIKWVQQKDWLHVFIYYWSNFVPFVDVSSTGLRAVSGTRGSWQWATECYADAFVEVKRFPFVPLSKLPSYLKTLETNHLWYWTIFDVWDLVYIWYLTIFDIQTLVCRADPLQQARYS